MAIDLDLTRELRGVDGLRSLVRAIVAADPSDETLWIEWKTDIDLTDKSGCMKVASAILGMANRPVEEAARVCQGFGYLVVGAEPGNLVGVHVPDPADWVTRVEQYLRNDVAPIWAHTTIPVDGVNVLVVTVDPPKHGDPIWTVRKELTPVLSGTVFIRKPGKTERATAKDMDALQQRLLAGGTPLPDLAVEIVGDVPVPWLPGPATLEHASAWARSERDRRAAEAQAVEEERNQPAKTQEVAEPLDYFNVGRNSILREAAKYQEIARALQSAMANSGLAHLQSEPDQRTLNEYVQQLDEWAVKLEKAAHEDLLRRYFERGHGVAHVKVTNNSTQYLPDVEVRLNIDVDQVKGFEEVPLGAVLPAAPRAFGARKPNPLLAASFGRPYLPPFASYDIAPSTNYVRDTTIEDGSIHLTLDAGEIRPRRQYTGDAFHILLVARPDQGKLPVTWSATVKDRDWIMEGTFDLLVQEDPIHVPDLFADDPENEENEEDDA